MEWPLAARRLRTDAAERFNRGRSGNVVIWKVLMVAETGFRRLNRPELLANVYHGAECQTGIEDHAREAAA